MLKEFRAQIIYDYVKIEPILKPGISNRIIFICHNKIFLDNLNLNFIHINNKNLISFNKGIGAFSYKKEFIDNILSPHSYAHFKSQYPDKLQRN